MLCSASTLKKVARRALLACAFGSGVGFVFYLTIGGVGIAARGTAVGANLVHFVLFGAITGLIVYAIWSSGVIVERSKHQRSQ